MLTSDLVRARVFKGEVRPRYLDADDADHLALATELVATYARHVGASREALEGALAALLGEGTDFLLHRGLAKLLSDRAEFTVTAPCEPSELRRRLFEEAARHHPVVRVADAIHTVTRDDVMATVARELSVDPTTVIGAMYADLDDAQVMTRGPDIAPQALLHRYNLALAQAVVLKASSLTITMPAGDPARYRQLFRFVKFYRLMHRVSGTSATGYTLVLDGPMSIFHQSQKYGLQLAEFLPALVLCPEWKAEAAVQWGRERKPLGFTLSSTQRLVSHYPDKGVYITREEQWLIDRWEALGTDWSLERRSEVLDLGGRGVLIPDFVLRHRADGRVALLEILGFWRKEYLHARWKLLREEAPGNLVVAVPWRLRGSEEEAGELPMEVMPFKDVILARELLERVERVATVEAFKQPVALAHTVVRARRKRTSPAAKDDKA